MMELDAVLREVWILYALATLIIILRYVVRFRTVGIKGLYWDDLFCVGVLIFNTLDAVTVHIVHLTGESSIVTPQWLETATQADIDKLTYGSKLEYTAWCSYGTLIWCMKFAMLFFYQRLTLGSFHAKMIKYLFWFTGISYFIVWMVLIFGCYPTQMNWQVSPQPPWKCAFRTQNFLAIGILNVLTDAAILFVPIPMLWKLKVPLKKKLTIGVVLSSGLFVIAAAIVRVTLSLDSAPSAANINGWGVRETFIAIFTINVPILRPILSSAFWRPGRYNPNGQSNRNGSTWGGADAKKSTTATSAFKSWKAGTLNNMNKGSQASAYELESGTASPRMESHDEERSTSSMENIIIPSKSYGDDRVMVKKSYAIRSEKRDAEEDSVKGQWNSIGVPR